MEMTRVQVKVLLNHDAVVQTAAEQFVDLAVGAIQTYGRFHVALSGGTTPKNLYALLATDRYAALLDWSRVNVFWGDERCVPPDHPMSNYRIVRETLIDHVPLPTENVHRIYGEDDPVAAAAAYESELRNVFGTSNVLSMHNGRFDLILLGMGDDGHIASLFPGLTAVHERERWVMAQYSEEDSMWRITCTPVLFNAAAAVVFLITGRDKAAMLHHVLKGPYQPEVFPAQVIKPHDGSVCWLLDVDAAANLTESGKQ